MIEKLINLWAQSTADLPTGRQGLKE